MMEAEWYSCSDPQKMLDSFRNGSAQILELGRFIPVKVSARKLRLFAAACYRRIWPLLTQEYSREAIEVAEQLADGHASYVDIFPILVAFSQDDRVASQVGEQTLQADAFAAARCSSAGAMMAAVTTNRQAMWTIRNSEWSVQAGLLHDIFGPPNFRLVALDSSWLPPKVIGLAQAAYEQRQLPSGHLDPALLAILADALEEAGCTDAEVLGHLRGEGPHVRGCWPVDLCLGKG